MLYTCRMPMRHPQISKSFFAYLLWNWRHVVSKMMFSYCFCHNALNFLLNTIDRRTNSLHLVISTTAETGLICLNNAIVILALYNSADVKEDLLELVFIYSRKV